MSEAKLLACASLLALFADSSKMGCLQKRQQAAALRGACGAGGRICFQGSSCTEPYSFGLVFPDMHRKKSAFGKGKPLDLRIKRSDIY